MARPGRREREEYEELKRRKKRQLERQKNHARMRDYDPYEIEYGMDDYDDIEIDDIEIEEEMPVRRRRSAEDLDRRYQNQNRRPRQGQRRNSSQQKKEAPAKPKGGGLAKVQMAAGGCLLAAFLYLGMIPLHYIAILALLWILLVMAAYRMQNKKKKAGAGRVLACGMILLAAGGCYYSIITKAALDKISVEGQNLADVSGINTAKEPFSIYISGIDVYGEITQESRSDVNIIATVNPNTHEVLLTTTPRDYYVEIPGVTNGEKDKLTHAGIYGIDRSMATLGALYEMEVPFYVRVNFTSLIEMVDVLGGIDVKSDMAFTTSEDSECVMDVKEGMNHFNGKQALAFCRERHNLPDGDNQRGKHQQAVIEAMIKKVMSPMILVCAPKLLDKVSESAETNMTEKQMQSLVKNQLTTLKGWNIHSVAATGTGDRAYCYSYSGNSLYVTIPDMESIANIESMINAVEAGEKLE